MSGLFANLPTFPVALPADELRLLRRLRGCDWPSNQEVDEEDHAPARRLADRGLLKISRQKSDPVAMWPTWYAGLLSSAALRAHTDILADKGEP